MPGYLNPRDMPPAVRQVVEDMRAGAYAAFDALFRAPEGPPDAPAPPAAPEVRESHPEITMAQRLAVWHSDPERARAIRAAMVVEWGEPEVRVEEEDAILYP